MLWCLHGGEVRGRKLLKRSNACHPPSLHATPVATAAGVHVHVRIHAHAHAHAHAGAHAHGRRGVWRRHGGAVVRWREALWLQLLMRRLLPGCRAGTRERRSVGTG